MRRRRPTRLRMRVDREQTAAMNFRDRDSAVMNDGRHLYFGADAEGARQEAFRTWNGVCARCGKFTNQPHWHHIRSKGLHLRDDHPRNREFLCPTCHLLGHNREPRWTRKEVAEMAQGLNG